MIRAEKKRPVQRNHKNKHGCPRREKVAGLGIAVSRMPRPLWNKNSILNRPIFRILCSFYDGCKDLMMLMFGMDAVLSGSITPKRFHWIHLFVCY